MKLQLMSSAHSESQEESTDTSKHIMIVWSLSFKISRTFVDIKIKPRLDTSHASGIISANLGNYWFSCGMRCFLFVCLVCFLETAPFLTEKRQTLLLNNKKCVHNSNWQKPKKRVMGPRFIGVKWRNRLCCR